MLKLIKLIQHQLSFAYFKIIFWILFFFFFAFSFTLYAQKNTYKHSSQNKPQLSKTKNKSNGCGFDFFRETNRKNPDLLFKENVINDKIHNSPRLNALRGSNDTLILPVVFHIIHTNPDAITDAFIINAVKDLNDAFSKKGQYSTSLGADVKIRFCLAHIDPNGGVTNGITRNVSFFSNYMNAHIEDSRLKNLIQWPPDSYVNIWYIQSLEMFINSTFDCSGWNISKAGGYATLPGGSPDVDGIVVTAFERMLAHEMGHYLGLYHTFMGGCKNYDCTTDGDMVCDTPPDRLTSDAPACNLPDNSCKTDTLSGFVRDTADLISNFMDYGNTNCHDEFTQGQTDRMWLATLNFRSGLLQPKCDYTCNTTAVAYFKKDINYPVAGDLVSFTNNSTGATRYEWYINDVLIATTTNCSYLFSVQGKNKVALKAFNGTDTCFASYISYVIVNCGVTARFYPSANEIASLLPDFPDTVIFNNTSVGANQFSWYVTSKGITTLASTNKTFYFVPPTPDSFYVYLVAANGACSDITQSQEIIVHDPTPDGTVNLYDFICYQDSGLQFNVQLCNSGYADIPSNMPISFYENNPNLPGARLMGTYYTNKPVKGNCCNNFSTFLAWYHHTGLKNVYAVFNDTGQLITPIKLPTTSLKEGSYLNNITPYTYKYIVNINPAIINTAFPYDIVTISANSNEPTHYYSWSPSLNLSCTICQSPQLTIDSNRIKNVIGVSDLGCRDTPYLTITVPPHNDFTIKINNAKCIKQDSMDIDYTIKNKFLKGKVLKNLRVAFYNGNPHFAGAVLLPPIYDIPALINSNTVSKSIRVKGMPAGKLWAVVNDTAIKIPIQLPSTWYTETNFYNNTDSITYDPATYSYFYPVLCEGKKYLDYNATGIYRDTFAGSTGCDSVRVVDLTILPRSYFTIDKIICEDSTFLNYNATGTYRDTFIAANTCDSVRIINLYIAKRTSSYHNKSICAGDTLWGHYKTGVYTDTLSNFYGCDSFRTLNLFVKPRSYNSLNVTICERESFLGHTATGKYSDTLIAANSCDSVVFTNLTVNPIPLPNLGPNRELCYVDSTQLFGGIFSSYLWNTGDITKSILIDKAGTYWLQTTNEYNCSNEDTITIFPVFCNNLNIPNVFSPNGDNINDTWVINSLRFFNNPQLSVYDRWGHLLIRFNGYKQPWNGTVNGNKMPLGTYYYTIFIKEINQMFGGSITILY